MVTLVVHINTLCAIFVFRFICKVILVFYDKFFAGEVYPFEAVGLNPGFYRVRFCYLIIFFVFDVMFHWCYFVILGF
jgi:hypothetical protein